MHLFSDENAKWHETAEKRECPKSEPEMTELVFHNGKWQKMSELETWLTK